MEVAGDQANDGPGAPDRACPHCGAANLAAARVCEACGRRLDLRHRSGATPGFAAEDAFQSAGMSEGEAAPRFRPLDSDDLPDHGESATFPDDPPIGGMQICAQCGARDSLSARFCRACGSRLGAVGGARSTGFGRIMIAVVGIGALIAVAALAGRVWRHPPARLAPSSSAPSDLAPASSSAAAPAPAVPGVGAPATAAPPPPSPTPPPDTVAERMIPDPIWVRRPDAAAVSALYPARARDRGAQGQATIDCAVRRDGRLGACRIVAEYPVRQGFGRATLNLAPSFRMKALTRSGQPVAGRRVRVPILWRLADSR